MQHEAPGSAGIRFRPHFRSGGGRSSGPDEGGSDQPGGHQFCTGSLWPEARAAALPRRPGRLYDDKALEQYRKTHKGNFTLQRYKGLGEMDAAQLWETTLNPETRILKKVEIEDARIASDITGLLMGPDVPPRKAFIYKHAHDAELDI